MERVSMINVCLTITGAMFVVQRVVILSLCGDDQCKRYNANTYVDNTLQSFNTVFV